MQVHNIQCQEWGVETAKNFQLIEGGVTLLTEITLFFISTLWTVYCFLWLLGYRGSRIA